MKTTKTEVIELEQDTLVSIQCDRCGKEVEPEDGITSDITTCNLVFGYGSKFDCETWEIDICDDCAEELVASFKNQPKRSPY